MQLMFLVAAGRWKLYRDRMNAAANGAVLVPEVQESSISIITALMKSISSGYPGECLHLYLYSLGDFFNSG
jgi:hypothetical protein